MNQQSVKGKLNKSDVKLAQMFSTAVVVKLLPSLSAKLPVSIELLCNTIEAYERLVQVTLTQSRTPGYDIQHKRRLDCDK